MPIVYPIKNQMHYESVKEDKEGTLQQDRRKALESIDKSIAELKASMVSEKLIGYLETERNQIPTDTSKYGLYEDNRINNLYHLIESIKIANNLPDESQLKEPLLKKLEEFAEPKKINSWSDETKIELVSLEVTDVINQIMEMNKHEATVAPTSTLRQEIDLELANYMKNPSGEEGKAGIGKTIAFLEGKQTLIDKIESRFESIKSKFDTYSSFARSIEEKPITDDDTIHNAIKLIMLLNNDSKSESVKAARDIATLATAAMKDSPSTAEKAQLAIGLSAVVAGLSGNKELKDTLINKYQGTPKKESLSLFDRCVNAFMGMLESVGLSKKSKAEEAINTLDSLLAPKIG